LDGGGPKIRRISSRKEGGGTYRLELKNGGAAEIARE